MSIYYDQTGRSINLADQALNSGGEGAIFEIIGYPKKVVKKYHHECDAKSREDKIREMVRISSNQAFNNANIAQDVAWPLAQIFDQGNNFIGFGMNKIAFSTELDDLYVYPAKQNLHFSIKDRIDCLISLSDVVDRIHQVGLVFGDGNPDNLKIRDDYTVCFIDVDSFHFTSNGKTYRCEVCAPGYVAPELIKACKGTTYADCPGQTFTEETDNFALAIHCFRMLMNGCHPFICQRQMNKVGSAPAPKSTDSRIEAGETPFFLTIPNYTTPSYAPDINALPPYIVALFKRAFVDGHTNPKARPTPAEWKKALIQFKSEIKQCAHHHDHFYWKDNSTCPYCEADTQYSKRMATSLVSTSNTIQYARTPTYAAATNNYTVSVTNNYIPSVVVNPGARKASLSFWLITIAISIAIVSILGSAILPALYNSIVGEPAVTSIGTVGGCISGLIGTIVFNCCWAPGRHLKYYEWKDYLYSALTCIGFAFGFGIVMGLFVLCFYLILVVAIVCGIIGALSGG